MRSPYFADDQIMLWQGDALTVLRDLPDASVDCCVTSPPYWALRDYGVEGQLGTGVTPGEFVSQLADVFDEVRRVLAADGTCWVNLGDTYSGGARTSSDTAGGRTAGRVGHAHPSSGLPGKNLIGIPWRFAFAAQDRGWILRNDLVWTKPNAMPESVTDRLSNRKEYVFLLTKEPSYWFDLDPIRQPHADSTIAAASRARKGYTPPGQRTNTKTSPMHSKGANPGDVWEINTTPFPGAHFATMPPALAERCILAGCKPGGVVLDPFSGSGTTGMAALKVGRRYVGIDLNADYLDLSLRTRLAQPGLDLTLDGAA